ncbi:elongation factor tu GTP binding domain-containing protein [Ditylenchus destructor]|uniref:Elongation factor tu GTP binding domain-containing protein n=1 Tax=Ditylenchus destructor TaxID=166010 RepID=A0AAD4QTJ8_9BILA|nr:elongation factor tu GTP binding domain-containing protein [Ditylenchus destructor]
MTTTTTRLDKYKALKRHTPQKTQIETQLKMLPSSIVTLIRQNMSIFAHTRFHFHTASPLKPVKVEFKRNIGIVAHIDAGKTTTTERLLYLTGASRTIGDVDDGNTVTDWMDLERERGITIQAAAVSSMWRDHRINLIDTPGHVDFTFEVGRSLRVLDGTITVLDGSAGVQAQTLTVWRQAKKFQLPSVFFVNKMDKQNADFYRSIETVEQRLSHRVIPIVIPVLSESGKFIGAIDLLNRTYLNTTEDEVSWTSFDESFLHYDLYRNGWENMVSELSDVDKEFERIVVNSAEDIPTSAIVSALRRATLNLLASPIVCGTALKSVSSVKPMLDMVVDYLPSPNHRPHRESVLHNANICALVFKISHDKQRGPLSYARILKGKLHENLPLLNANRYKQEDKFKLFEPFGDLLQPISDILVFSGLTSTITGDTLINSNSVSDATLKSSEVQDELNKFVLEGITTPDPVYSCSIEPPSNSSRLKFEKALAELCVEDPSLHIRQDQDTGQTVLEGMGELHIEVIKERLRREYDLNVFIGPLQVGYKEILKRSIIHECTTEATFDNKHNWCNLKLQLDPSGKAGSFKTLTIKLEQEEDKEKAETTREIIKPQWLKAINEGCRLALYNGPSLGFPISGIEITLKSLATSNFVNAALLSAAASRCVQQAMDKAGSLLMEPVMSIEVTLIRDGPDDSNSNYVLTELGHRRAVIKDIEHSKTY